MHSGKETNTTGALSRCPSAARPQVSSPAQAAPCTACICSICAAGGLAWSLRTRRGRWALPGAELAEVRTWSGQQGPTSGASQTDTGRLLRARLGYSLALLLSNGDMSPRTVGKGQGRVRTLLRVGRAHQGPSEGLGKNQFDWTVTQCFAREPINGTRRPDDERLACSLKGGRCRRICVSLAYQSL